MTPNLLEKPTLEECIKLIKGATLPITPLQIFVTRTPGCQEADNRKKNLCGWETRDGVLDRYDVPTIQVPDPLNNLAIEESMRSRFTSRFCIKVLAESMGPSAPPEFIDDKKHIITDRRYNAKEYSRFGLFRFSDNHVTAEDVLAFFEANHIKPATTRDLFIFAKHYTPVSGDKIIGLGSSDKSVVEVKIDNMFPGLNWIFKKIGSSRYVDPAHIQYPMVHKQGFKLVSELTTDRPEAWNNNYHFLGEFYLSSDLEKVLQDLWLKRAEYTKFPRWNELPDKPFCEECLGIKYVTKHGYVFEVVRGEDLITSQARFFGCHLLHGIPDYGAIAYRPLFTDMIR